MSWFWSSSVAQKVELMRAAEDKLWSLATKFGGRDPSVYDIQVFDTKIPRSVVPLKQHCCGGSSSTTDEELVIHGAHLSVVGGDDSSKQGIATASVPLVLLHGFMNGSAYYYRNVVGLSHYFRSIYSVDMLGWGLSSRPAFDLDFDNKNNNNDDAHRRATEDFFVDSLEAWRIQNKIDRMVLAGHSMGGYLSVAYCEKYPQNVERLILISPVGVPEESDDVRQRRAERARTSWTNHFAQVTHRAMFHSQGTLGGLIRMMPAGRAQRYCRDYVERRIPAITDTEEREALADYLFINNALPGSGEYCCPPIMNEFAYAKKPTVYRIPNLQVESVTFLYGTQDWMEAAGGLQVQTLCQQKQAQQDANSQYQVTPKVGVYHVRDAGHMLFVDNWEEFNSGLLLGAGGKQAVPPGAPMPIKLEPGTSSVNASSPPRLVNTQPPQQTPEVAVEM